MGHPVTPSEKLVSDVARAIAEGLGDEFDHAFTSKSEWNAARGEKGGRYRDINEPRQSDYVEAAQAAIAIVVEKAAEVAEGNRTDDDSMWDRCAAQIANALLALSDQDSEL